MMDLMIDTTERGKIKLGLFRDRDLIGSTEKETDKISESLLLEIERLMKKCKVTLQDLKQISVNPGPGGFSSTRTGVAVANALSYALGIPVIESSSGRIKEMVVPKYDKQPNITKAKGIMRKMRT